MMKFADLQHYLDLLRTPPPQFCDDTESLSAGLSSQIQDSENLRVPIQFL